MNKRMKSFLFCLLAVLLALSFVSCADNVELQENSNSSSASKALYEMEKLASEDELNKLSTRGDDDIVDWELSKEFAQLWLENGIDEGDYPSDSELWEIPIAVYNTDGEIQYYEFRVTSNGEVVAAITGAARKSFGCPIVYEFATVGYSDDISKLYAEGKLSADELPRIIDNGYPGNYAVGIINETRGVDDGFDYYLDPESMESVEKSYISIPMTYDDVINNCPELLAGYIEDEKMQAMIEDYLTNGKEFWKYAVANKGHIADFAVRGGSKSKPKTSIDGLEKYRNYVNKKRNQWGGYTYESLGGGFLL